MLRVQVQSVFFTVNLVPSKQNWLVCTPDNLNSQPHAACGDQLGCELEYRDCIVEHMRGITHRPLVLGTAVQLNRVWSRRVIRLGHTFLDCVH